MRIVRHIGARTFDGSTGLSPQVLCALPVLRGERIVWIEGEFYGATQADEPPEQPSLVQLWVGFLPGVIFENIAVTTATLQAEVTQYLLGDAVGNSAPYGGEPNASADEAEWMEGDQIRQLTGARVLWRRTPLTNTRITGGNAGSGTLVSGSGTFAPFGKQGFYEKFKIKGGTFPVNGVVVAGYNQPQVTAQTTFGVTELDDQMTLAEIINGLTQGDKTADADTAKIQELFYGGDNYIEADTLKDWDGRAYCRMTAGFTGGSLARLVRGSGLR